MSIRGLEFLTNSSASRLRFAEAAAEAAADLKKWRGLRWKEGGVGTLPEAFGLWNSEMLV